MRAIFLTLAVALSPSAALAEINVGDSLEWRTDDSDLVVRGRVTRVERAGSEGDAVIERLHLAIGESLKGSARAGQISFLVARWSHEDWTERARRDRADLVFFLARGQGDLRGVAHGDWMLRDGPSTSRYDLGALGQTQVPRDTDLIAIRADMTRLSTAAEVVAAIRARAALGRSAPPRDRSEHAGLLDPRGAVVLEAPPGSAAAEALYGGSSVYVVVPPDPEYRPIVLRLAGSSQPFERARAARMLASYRGPDIDAALRRLRADADPQVREAAQPR